MASHLEAIIFDGDPQTAALPDGLKTVLLTAGLTMLPLTHEALEQLGAEDPNDDRIQPDWTLRRAVATLAERMSADRQVLYVFGETWAGSSIQEAAGWREGRLFYGPTGTCDLEADREPGYRVVPPEDMAINGGLSAMGVQAAPSVDEFETIGLTRHRMTEDWIDT
jgi:hypothetical protein